MGHNPNTIARRQTSPRKHYSLARAKLAVYANRMKAVRKAGRALNRVGRDSEEYERKSKRYRSKMRIAQRYYKQFHFHYNSIPPPCDPESARLNSRLSELDAVRRTVYVMRTGFGKGFSFDDKHIAVAIGIRKADVDTYFLEALNSLDAIFEEYLPAESSALISEITKLSPELLTHLKVNEQHLCKPPSKHCH